MARINSNVDLMEGRSATHAPMDFGDDPPETGAPTPLEARMTQMEQKTEAELTLNRLVSDPNIREYLTKLQQGVKVKLVEDKPESLPEPELKDPEGDPETMTSGELAKYLEAKSLVNMQKMLKPMMATFQEQIGQLASVAQGIQSQGVESEIKTLRTKYKDFTGLEPQMRELNNKVKGTLSLEELYRAVKGIRGEFFGRVPNPSSERPDAGTGREVPRTSTNKPPAGGPKLGRVGFQNIINGFLAGQPDEE